jgi:hypothetical protein
MGRCGLFLVTIGIALLEGCGSGPSGPATAAATIDPRLLPPGEFLCQSVARERADDAVANGYSFNIEGAVYQETYDDCMARHAHDAAN